MTRGTTSRVVGVVAAIGVVVVVGRWLLLPTSHEEPTPDPPAAAPADVRAAIVEKPPVLHSPAKAEVPAASAPEPAAASHPAPVAASDRRATIDRSTREYLERLKVPAGVAAEAKTLGVSEATLRTMYAAELLLHYGGDSSEDRDLRAATEEAIAALARSGDEGFRALLANVQGNPTNTSRADAMARATYRPGLEAPLLEWLRKRPKDVVSAAPLRALGGMDSPEVRAYLREALDLHEDHATNFASTAQALGALREPTGAAAIGAKLRNPYWSGLRASLLDSLGRMGGLEAKSALVDYLRDPKGDHESHAVRSLAEIDRAAARAEAQTIVAGDGPNRAEPAEVSLLRAFLAED